MAKKEPEYINYVFEDKYGHPIYSARIAASQQTIKNMIDEFKYYNDLKTLAPDHCEQFIEFIKKKDVKVERGYISINWG
jgi:hypothetical protein